MKEFGKKGLQGLFFLTGLWGLGLGFFYYDMSTFPAQIPSHVDGVVVLTGGAQRLEEGLDLLHGRTARRLLVSGVHKDVKREDILPHLTLPVDLGYEAHDTIGNAREAKQWAHTYGYKSLILVTAHYHMRRTLLEFNQRLPEMAIYAYPVRPSPLEKGGWWRRAPLVLLVVSEYNKYILALGRALVRAIAIGLGLA